MSSERCVSKIKVSLVDFSWHYLSFSLKTLEGAAGHCTDFSQLFLSFTESSHRFNESSDCLCDVISETTLKPHKSQDIICMSRSGVDGLYFIGCRVKHSAIANPSCFSYSHHWGIFTEQKDIPRVQSLNNVIDLFLIIVFWLEVALCYYKVQDLV